MSFFSNIGDAFSEVGDFFSDGWECMKKGNILDGIGNWATGAADAVGNTMTLGGAHALGKQFAETDFGESIGKHLGEHKLLEDERNEKCAQGWKDIQEYWSLAGDHFKNGNIMGGIHEGFMGVLGNAGNYLTLGQAGRWGQSLVDRIESGKDVYVAEKMLNAVARNSADLEIAQENAEAAGAIGSANAIGTINLAKDALGVAGAAALAHGGSTLLLGKGATTAFANAQSGALGVLGAVGIGTGTAAVARSYPTQDVPINQAIKTVKRDLPDVPAGADEAVADREAGE